MEQRTGRSRPGWHDVRGACHGGRGTRGSGLCQRHIRTGAGQCPCGRPQPRPDDSVRRRFGRAHRGPQALQRPRCGWNRFIRRVAAGHLLGSVRIRRGVAPRAHDPVRHGDRRPRHNRVIRSQSAYPAGAAVGPDPSGWRGHGGRRAVRLHQVRQAGGYLASARRHRNADRPVAGRAGFADRGVAGAH